MSKMTKETFATLYNSGKSVYLNEIGLNEAANMAHKERPEVAVSSAVHYIKWYSRMMEGNFLSWSSNTDLLIYYVNNIVSEQNKAVSAKAICGARKYAKCKNNVELDNILIKIANDNGIELLSVEIQQESMNSEMIGVFDSWEILDENTAVKTCDKSFFEHKGSGIPKEICWFFTADSLGQGKSKNITLYYEGKKYSARVTNESSDRRRTRIFWYGDLARELYQYKNKGVSMATFVKISDDAYQMNMETKDAVDEFVESTDNIEFIKRYILNEGYSFPGKLIENFYLCLKTKPFVLLAGTSGTGKTRLVRLFAEAIGAKESSYLQIAVKPDWSDSTDLFGHVNLNGEFVPGDIVKFVKAATDDVAHPYILCLDEMNLARVEYYFSDFLSIIETRDRIENEDVIVTDRIVPKSCYSGNEKATKLYGNLIIPENLYIVGTVNMDETTFPFSKKVLDRANTIEFSGVDFDLNDEAVESCEPIIVGNDFLKSNYLNLRKDCREKWELVNRYNDEIKKINGIFEKSDAHFGYRVRDEIIFYMLNRDDVFGDNADSLSENEAFDNQIMQKVLPRLQGSSESLANILEELFVVCAGPYKDKVGSQVSEKMEQYLNGSGNVKYPNSAKKICKMLRRYEADDFTSYWV